MKRKISIVLLIMVVSLFYCTAQNDGAFAAQKNTPKSNIIGLTLESRGSEPPPSGTAYMSDIAFTNLIKQADSYLAFNKFDHAYALLAPYEVYVFGSNDHWTNMERYDWRMFQVFERKGDSANMRFYLKCITDDSLQPLPTKHQVQYIDIVDESGVSTGHYYLGAALRGRDLQIRVAAIEKLAMLNQVLKPFGRPDPRMRYDNFPGRSYRRTSGF